MTRTQPDATAHVALAHGVEFDLVRAMLARWGDIAKGIGDDAAEIHVPPSQPLVVSTDTSVEGVHFRMPWITPAEIGYRATATALSDLAAMAATPLGLTVAITLPDSWRTRLGEIADGIGAAARDSATPIVGGDLVAGPTLSLTITVFGCGATLLRRSAARPGDAVWVTGLFGGPGLALAAWMQGRAPVAEHRARFAHPVPRLREAQWLAQHGATAAIDCSDGLAADAGHIAAASNVRLEIDLNQLPIVAHSSADDAIRGGEEYELIVTGPESLDAQAFVKSFGVALTRIGGVVEAARSLVGGVSSGVTLHRGGRPVPAVGGFEHFRP